MRLLLAVCVSLGALTARAADQPVPVQDEPMHRTVFENDYLRVIDVNIPPGKTTQFHRHVIPSVVVYLTKSTNQSESWPDGALVSRDVAPGQSRYAPYDQKPLAHRVTNTGTAPFRVFDIELLKKPAAARAVAPIPQATPHWDEKLVRSSGLTLTPDRKVFVPANPLALLVVGIAGNVRVAPSGSAPAAPRTLRWGEYQFVPPQTALALSADGDATAEAVLLELKP